mmetsp:Transcript_58838/g.137422  ORF Transcript_58838/g.137422 Transcript_58838/m.137422 type:complete len:317 (-) Transcript_58838:112-1062(-)
MATELWWLAMSKAADARTVGICACKWVLFVAVWHAHPLVWIVLRPCLVFAMALWGFFVAAVVHNAMHRDVFIERVVETVWRVILSSTFGFPVEAYKPTHNLNHHVHTQHEEDHLHTAQMNYKSPLLNLVFFFPTVYPGICRLEKEFLSRELSNFCHRRSSRLPLFVLQAVAAHATTIFIMLVDWRRGLVYWIIPNLLAVDGIITMNMLQHDGCETIARGEHRGSKMNINSARNFTGPIQNWFFCNNGYHTIHHMYSTAHWSELPAMHSKMVEPYIHPMLVEPCVVRYVWRTYVWPGLGPSPRLDIDGREASSVKDQ